MSKYQPKWFIDGHIVAGSAPIRLIQNNATFEGIYEPATNSHIQGELKEGRFYFT
jgi:hypothetical protein